MDIAGVGTADALHKTRGLHAPGSSRPVTPTKESDEAGTGDEAEQLVLSEELKEEQKRTRHSQGVKPVEGVKESSESQGVGKISHKTPSTDKLEDKRKANGVDEREQRKNFNRTGSNSLKTKNRTLGAETKVTYLDSTSAAASANTHTAGMTLNRIRKVGQTRGQQNTASLNQDRPNRPMTRDAYIAQLQKTFSTQGNADADAA